MIENRTITVMVGRGPFLKRNSKSFRANLLAVDLGHFWANSFFEELGLSMETGEDGGYWSIDDFSERLKGVGWVYWVHAWRIGLLIERGKEEGATHVHWI